MFRFINIFVFIVPVTFQLLIPDNNQNHALDLANLAVDILQRECQTCSTILSLSTTNDITQNLFLANISLSRKEMTIMSVKVENFSTAQIGHIEHYSPDITIIFINEENQIEEILYAVELESFWHIRGKFLVIATGIDEIEDDWMKEFFENFWSRQALHVLLCFWNDGAKIYSYDPYYENYKIHLSNATSSLYRKKIRNMNGYPIKLYQFDNILKDGNQMIVKDGKQIWKGMEGLFYTTVGEILNGSLQVHRLSEDIPETLINQADFNTPFADFLDLLIGAYDFDATFDCVRVHDMNISHLVFLDGRNDYYLVVPKGEGIPRYMYLFGIIPLNVWLSIQLSLFGVTVTIFCIQKYFFKKNDVILLFMDNIR